VEPDGLTNQLSLEVVYHDEHLIEVECRVAVGEWSGVARGYSTQRDLEGFASHLHQFGETLRGPAEWTAGDDSGGMIALRFYTIDKSGHTRCHVRLATNPPTEHRAEEVWRFAAELPTEPGLVITFARQLKRVAAVLDGQAVLAGVEF
jgi:hypothetical protein